MYSSRAFHGVLQAFGHLNRNSVALCLFKDIEIPWVWPVCFIGASLTLYGRFTRRRFWGHISIIAFILLMYSLGALFTYKSLMAGVAIDMHNGDRTSQ